MSTTAIRVVPQPDPEVTALAKVCEHLAEQSALDRFEIAVKSRLATGINDDNDLRITDELLHQVVLGGDAVEAATKPAISSFYARHKMAIATVEPWKKRWASLADSLKGAILKYRRAKEDLARRQQMELERAAQAERDRLAAEARAALRNGDVATAKAATQEAAAVVTPVIMEATPVLDNSSGRKVWQAEIIDPEALVKAIAAGIVPLSAIREFDVVFLKKEAAKRGGLPATWAGVRCWQEDQLSVRR